MWKRLLDDDCGMINSVDYLFMTCVVAIAGLVGVATFRDQLSQEAGDVGLAIDQLDQTYIYVVPGVGYDPNVPFDPNNPVGYKVSEFDDPDGDNDPDPSNPLNFVAATGGDSEVGGGVTITTDSN